MIYQPNGKLVPVGGGDPIPLLRPSLKIGRRDSCDICLRFPNISGLHCELTFVEGYWKFSDAGSTNGVKVNGVRVQKKALRPGDELSIGSRRYKIEYDLAAAVERTMIDDSAEVDFLNQPLLEKAGLVSKPRDPDAPRASRSSRLPNPDEPKVRRTLE